MRALWVHVKDFDVVHVHAWWNLVSIFSCWIALIRGVPVVLSPRGTLSAYSFINKNNLPKKLIHSSLGKRLLKKCSIHVTSAREKTAIEGIIHPKRIINIPNFIALPSSTPLEAKRSPGPLKLLFFSRIEEKKGLDILFDALSSVTAPYHLTIAGDGKPEYVERLKSIAALNGISTSLSWVGFQGENKFDLLHQHDVMILPSYDENFGNVVIESLSMGTAVLISKNVGLADYVAENNFGWVCELDKHDISNFIDRINTESDLLMTIRKQAPMRIRQDFNEENLARKYRDMYNQIINNDSI
jgi:glycosyltransferase involved in cell wall biosynthesis